MIIGFSILLSSVMAFVGFRKGLYVMFATVFNQLFATFIAVLSTRKIVLLSPGFEQNEHYAAVVLFLLYIFIFAVLQFFAWFYFLRSREDYFPIIFDKICAVILGFISGHIISCVVLLSLCVGLGTLTESDQVKKFCMRQKIQKTTTPVLVKACDFLAWYSLECFDGDTQASLEDLLHINSQPENESPSINSSVPLQDRDASAPVAE